MTKTLPGEEKQILELEEDLSGKATKIFRLLEVEFSDNLKQAHETFQRAVTLFDAAANPKK